MKHFMSFFDNEQDCLKAILQIHNSNNDIDLDPMFFKGGFYKNGVNVPKLIFDIKPRLLFCPEGNAESLNISSESIQCMILDPLFMFEKRNRKQNNYTATTMGIINGFEELQRHYIAILTESHRILKNNGILIFKCQDYTDAKTTMTHCFVFKWATELGFYAKDLAILNIPQAKIYNSNTTQRHLRKTHCYFWVFQKKETKNENKEPN